MPRGDATQAREPKQRRRPRSRRSADGETLVMGEPQAWRRFLSIFPRRPERRWDLISEAMARPFGTRAGRGPTRNGAVENGPSERAAAGHDGRALSVCRLGALTSGQPRAESLRSRHHEQQCCGSSSGVGSIGDHENARGAPVTRISIRAGRSPAGTTSTIASTSMTTRLPNPIAGSNISSLPRSTSLPPRRESRLAKRPRPNGIPATHRCSVVATGGLSLVHSGAARRPDAARHHLRPRRWIGRGEGVSASPPLRIFIRTRRCRLAVEAAHCASGTGHRRYCRFPRHHQP